MACPITRGVFTCWRRSSSSSSSKMAGALPFPSYHFCSFYRQEIHTRRNISLQPLVIFDRRSRLFNRTPHYSVQYYSSDSDPHMKVTDHDRHHSPDGKSPSQPQPGEHFSIFESEVYFHSTVVSQDVYLNFAFKHMFFDALWKAISREVGLSHAEVQEVFKEIEERAKKLFAENKEMVIDGRASGHLRVCALVLASYDVMSKRTKDNDLIITLIRDAFLEQGTFFWKHLARMYVRDPKRNFRTLTGALRTHTKALGRTFETEVIPDLEGHSKIELNVSRCFYWEFFKRQKAEFLMPMFCAADNRWNEVMSPKRNHLTYTRKSTMPTGGEQCSFLFVKKPAVKPTDPIWVHVLKLGKRLIPPSPAPAPCPTNTFSSTAPRGDSKE